MKKGLFEKRIPTFAALLFLLVGLSATLLLVQNGVFIISRASPNQDPENIRIVNTTNNSFTVVFTTLDQTTAGISLDNNTSAIFFDERDKSGVKSFSNHFITVSNLSPNTKYLFSILSNGKSYLQDGKKFEATTAINPIEEQKEMILTGAVLQPDGNPGADTLIFASSKNSQEIAAITDSQGNYNLPLYLLVDSENKKVDIQPMDEIQIKAVHGALSSTATYSFQNEGTVPLITLSSNYSFIASAPEEQIGSDSSSLKFPIEINKSAKIKITVPKKNETFVDNRPVLQGTALPNAIVKITIHSQDQIQIQIRADPNGNWSYRPAVSLTVGPHTITIETLDASGNLTSVTSDFTIFASGSQIAENATPSATLIPTASPTIILTPTLTPTTIPSLTPSLTSTPSASPTGTITITPTATLTPTAAETPTLIPPTSSPIPTVIAQIPPKSTPPPASGDMTHTIFLTTVSILFIVAGSTLFFIL